VRGRRAEPDHHSLISSYNLANSYTKAGRLNEAIPMFERVLAGEPGEAPGTIS
jgi:hypothetical protein